MHSVNAMHTPQFMFQYLEGISKVMIVDFDAHQVSLWSHDCTVSEVKGRSTNTLRHYTHHTHTHHTHSPHTLTTPQGNGHERDFLNDDKVFIIDMYNKWIYPNDREAKGEGRGGEGRYIGQML